MDGWMVVCVEENVHTPIKKTLRNMHTLDCLISMRSKQVETAPNREQLAQ